jgi:hypothetical protein
VRGVAELGTVVVHAEQVDHDPADQHLLELQADLHDVGHPVHADLDLPLLGER